MLKSKLNLALLLALLFSATAATFGQKPQPLVQQPEDKLIAILNSDATQKAKADACRQLAVVGSKNAVAPLAGLLSDDKLSHMARYALETIPDASVDEALRKALGNLQGKPLVGVIGSVGVRRDAQAVKPLAGFLQDADSDVAQAAARALGKIGNTAASKELLGAVTKAPAGNQLAFCEGLFRCAETLSAKGQKKEAMAIYDQLRGLPGLAHQVRAGALRGAILNRDHEGLVLLTQALRGDDFVLTDAAIRTAMEMPGSEVTKALIAELSLPSVDKQVLLIQALGKRGDTAVLPVLIASAKTGAKPARIAAIRTLAEMGDASAVPVLMELRRDTDREIAQASQECLTSLPGHVADAAIITLLGSGQTSERLAAIDMIGRRRMMASIPALLSSASGADTEVRPAALKRLGEMGKATELPALLDLLGRFTAPRDLNALEQALSAICARMDKPEASVEQLVSRLTQAQPAQKGALLRVLITAGGDRALKTVRAAVEDANPEVHAAAIRALGGWKTSDAAPELLALAQSSPNASDKLLCLRGYLGWAANAELPADKRLAMCQTAAGLIQRTEEKKLLLSALGNIAAIESVSMIAPYLNDAATQNEAGAATVTVAEKLLRGNNAAKAAPSLIEPLQKAAQLTGNASLATRAKALLEQAKKAGGK